MQGKFQTFAMCLRTESLDRFPHAFPQAEVRRFKIQTARFNLGKVQDVVDHPQQQVRRGLRPFQIMPLLGFKLGPQSQVQHADHPVHWRPNFVAHARQKFALRLARRLRRLLRQLSLGSAFVLGQVPHNCRDRNHFPAGVHDR